MDFVPHHFFSSPDEVPLIIVEGNIGSGKTTLVRSLCRDKDLYDGGLIVNYEPVERFNYMLEGFYEHKEEYLFLLQLQVSVSSCYSMLEKKNVASSMSPKPQFIISDRSFESCDIFSRANNISSERYELLQQLKYHSLMGDIYSLGPFGECILHVYLKCSIDLCKKRIKKRDRDGEEKIDSEYLKKVELEHERYFERIEKKEKIFVIDTSEMNEEEVKEKVKKRIMEELERRRQRLQEQAEASE